MALNFPNPSRSFDASRKGVRFVGHDGVFEVPFFIEADALAKASKAAHRPEASQDDCLSAFDRLRSAIHDVAREIHGSRRRSSYTLNASDFR
ncbi:DUF1488 domain-containing protein [Stappia sp. WLB 29]|uniref:DUF1488 domain-containing protein n=1 Tax=Stappia sp. WLB 29 TaxID=2925220 RepID=UPI0020BE0AA1|nr:DUF1488 domain-containing protein [Stappia sp. WLB 29]